MSNGATPLGDRAAQSDYERAFEAIERLAALVEGSNDAILSLSREGQITSWNRAAADLYGYSAEEAIGQSIALVIPQIALRRSGTFLSASAWASASNITKPCAGARMGA